MSKLFIIDAHVHTGFINKFFSPEVNAESLLKRMDQFNVQYSINLSSMRAIDGSGISEYNTAENEYRISNGRIFYLGFYNPRRGKKDLEILKEILDRPGFKGIKIHPSFNQVPANDDTYEPVWEFAQKNDLPIVAHSWSVSSYNPSQILSTPDKFERFIKEYPNVRFVLAHSGGRGTGRKDAIQLVNKYRNVYMDFAGDIYDLHFLEKITGEIPDNKLLFGTDYPWFDIRSQLTRVYLAGIPVSLKIKIFRENALEVFKIDD